MPLLRASAASQPPGTTRVIAVPSSAHRMIDALDFTDLQSLGGFQPAVAYGRAKLANILFTRELARRADPEGRPLLLPEGSGNAFRRGPGRCRRRAPAGGKRSAASQARFLNCPRQSAGDVDDDPGVGDVSVPVRGADEMSGLAPGGQGERGAVHEQHLAAELPLDRGVLADRGGD